MRITKRSLRGGSVNGEGYGLFAWEVSDGVGEQGTEAGVEVVGFVSEFSEIASEGHSGFLEGMFEGVDALCFGEVV